jgi:hypothetical protein
VGLRNFRLPHREKFHKHFFGNFSGGLKNNFDLQIIAVFLNPQITHLAQIHYFCRRNLRKKNPPVLHKRI